MTIGLLPDAVKPGIHCVRTHWIRGFIGVPTGDPLRRGRIQVDVGVFAPDEPRHPRVLSLGEPAKDKGMNPLVTLSAYASARTARREGVRRGTDETHLLQWAALDSELADRAAGTPVIRLVGREELCG